MKLWNQLLPNPRNQARSAGLGGAADSDSDYDNIDAEGIGPQYHVASWLS